MGVGRTFAKAQICSVERWMECRVRWVTAVRWGTTVTTPSPDRLLQWLKLKDCSPVMLRSACKPWLA